MAQLKSTTVNGNLAVTNQILGNTIITDKIIIPDKSGYTGGSAGDASLACSTLTLTGGDMLTKYHETGIRFRDTYFLSFPSKGGTIAVKDDIPTIDTALSSTSTNPVQNRVITAALASKISSNTNTLTISFTGDNTTTYPIRLYWTDDSTYTSGTVKFPRKDGGTVTLATTDDIQSYIDTAILGGSW